MRYQKLLACAVLALNFAAGDRAAAALLGIDVSSWQSTVNWTSMKNAGVQFGFARATMGTVDFDSQFASNMNNSRTAGIQIGPYHYGYPNTAMNPLSSTVKQDAINEATDFVNRIKPYYDNNPGWYLRPVLDVEEVPSNAEVNTIAEQKTYLSAWIKDFNSVVKTQLGVDVIIYCNGNFANTYLTQDLSSYDLWFAKPTNSVTTNPPTDANMGIWSDYDFWQYSWEGNLGGESPLDLNHYRGTLNDLQEYVVGGEPPLAGDYNDDGVVDTADYTVWRDTWSRFNTTDMRADGNNNGTIDTGDRDVWAANFGAQSSAAVAVPEPTAIMVVGSLGLLSLLRKRGR
jgi:GH25 family lysozyme M1 (1,4-beta-N-acetylmuramidase)